MPIDNTNINNISVKTEFDDTCIDRDFSIDLPDLDDGPKEPDSFDQSVTNETEFSNETSLFQEFFVNNVQVQECDNYTDPQCKEENIEMRKDDQDVDGCNLDEEYASVVPISIKEAKAAVEVYKMFSHGKHTCNVCTKAFFSENRLKIHMRMHDKVGKNTYKTESDL